MEILRGVVNLSRNQYLSLKSYFNELSVYSSRQMIAFGVVLFINYPLYYLLWLHFESGGYENLYLRLAGSLLCLPLIFNRYLPKIMGSFLPVYWLIVACFCLPFFFTFMALMNHASTLWLMNCVSALFFLFLLFDTFFSIILSLVGSYLAVIIFLQSHIFSYNPGPLNIGSILSTFAAALVIGAIFSKNKQVVEEVKRRSIKAEKNSKAKSAFIANMSHDLRTPMTGIMGMITDIGFLADDVLNGFLRRDKDIPTLVNEIKKSARIAQGSNKELLSMFNDILEMVQLESGSFSDDSEHFDLYDLFQKQVNLMGSAARDKDLSVVINIPDTLPRFYEGYRRSLDRVLINLLSNALKFTDKGQIDLGADIDVSEPLNVGDSISVRLWVQDTGVGIPEDKFEEIFNHFYKLSASYKNSSYQGSGLGLYAVKQYVDHMNGRISVESKIDEGSRFTVTIPLVVSDKTDNNESDPHVSHSIQKEPSEIVEQSVEEERAGTHVLVVEDNPAAAMSVRGSLRRAGYTSDHASSGEEAIQMVSNNDYSLVFMDIGLPNMNGLEATQKIRDIDHATRSKVPIVALTGHEDRVEECREAGMQSLLQKPAQGDQLARMIKKHACGEKESISLPIMDWDACVSMCCGEEDAREIVSICAKEIRNSKEVIHQHFIGNNIKLLREELHKARGGVCYLKLPELEYRLRDFHVSIKENHNKDELDHKYNALVEAEDRFLSMCADRGLL